MSGEKDFLDDFAEQDAGLEPVEQPTQAEMEPAGRGPQRGPDGKFIKAEAEAKAREAETGAKEAAGMQPITEPPADDDESQTVPLSALKALRKELQELKRSQGTSAQTQPKAPQPQVPQVSIEQDPVAYFQQQIQILDQTRRNDFLNTSEILVRQQLGDEPVDAAIEAWRDYEASNPPQQVQFQRQTFWTSPHPYRDLLKWHQTQRDFQALQSAGSLEALIAQRMQQTGSQPAPQPPARKDVPVSLAGTGKARSSEAVSGEPDGFDALFKR